LFALSTIQDLAAAALRSDLALAGPSGRWCRVPSMPRSDSATAHLLHSQQADGHWVFELEADGTIPAEYLMLCRFFGRRDPAREARIGRYLRRLQAQQEGSCGGGWPLFHGGPLDISCSVKAYFALRLIGDPADAPHMERARAAILAAGGAEQSNVFTRATLALFGQVPWQAVPVMPPEIVLLPRWFPFHLSKISYWARTVLVPLTVVMAHRPQPLEPLGVSLAELFRTPPSQVKRWPGGAHAAEPWRTLFRQMDAVLQRAHGPDPRDAARPRRGPRRGLRHRAPERRGRAGRHLSRPWRTPMDVSLPRRAGERPAPVTAWAAIEKLVMERPDAGRDLCPALPLPDLGHRARPHALLEAGGPGPRRPPGAASLAARAQVTDLEGDWAEARPGIPPGGWAFQYANPHYPDVDDTAVVVLALDRARKQAGGSGGPADAAVARATGWVVGMQSKGGGWGAFDADNTHQYLNSIPFADHGALLDPPTADVSGRCLAMLAQLGLHRTAR
jgi:squalene-hopene/tetraprenyl-beta-curcumene cyclase